MHFFKTLVAFFLYVFFAMPSFSATLKPGEREEAHRFDVFLLGIKAGELRYHKSVKGKAYSAEAVLETTGLVALLAPYIFQAKVTGQRLKSRYFPQNYVETSDTGRRVTNKEMRYKNQRPTLLAPGERKKYWLNPPIKKALLIHFRRCLPCLMTRRVLSCVRSICRFLMGKDGFRSPYRGL